MSEKTYKNIDNEINCETKVCLLQEDVNKLIKKIEEVRGELKKNGPQKGIEELKKFLGLLSSISEKLKKVGEERKNNSTTNNLSKIEIADFGEIYDICIDKMNKFGITKRTPIRCLSEFINILQDYAKSKKGIDISYPEALYLTKSFFDDHMNSSIYFLNPSDGKHIIY